VRELVEIRVGRHEEELLVVIGGILFVSFDDLLTGSSSLLAARGRIAPGGQCGRRLAVEMGWHSEKGVLVFCGCLVCLPASLFSRYLRYVTLIPFLLVVFGMFGYLNQETELVHVHYGICIHIFHAAGCFYLPLTITPTRYLSFHAGNNTVLSPSFSQKLRLRCTTPIDLSAR
jgi:hypothetical protein